VMTAVTTDDRLDCIEAALALLHSAQESGDDALATWARAELEDLSGAAV
jgi:hypothetical protein